MIEKFEIFNGCVYGLVLCKTPGMDDDRLQDQVLGGLGRFLLFGFHIKFRVMLSPEDLGWGLLLIEKLSGFLSLSQSNGFQPLLIEEILLW